MTHFSLPTITQKMTQTKRLFFLLLCLAIGQVLVAQTTYTTTADGDWDDIASWDANGIPPEPIPANATVEVGHRVSIATNKTNDGTINTNGSGRIAVATNGALTNNGTINGNSASASSVEGALEAFSGGSIVNNSEIVLTKVGANQPNIVLFTGGSLTNNSGATVDLVDGDIGFFGTGLLTNEDGALIKIGGPSSIRTASTGTAVSLSNAGTIENNGFLRATQGEIKNLSTGVINMTSVGGSFSGALWILRLLTNEGEINLLNSSASITLFQSTLDSSTGVLNLNDGRLSGNGFLITPSVSHNGFLLPGWTQPPGPAFATIDITGTYQGTGTLQIRIQNPTSGIASSELTTTSSIDLSQLGLRLPDGGYDPPIGASYRIITATGGVTGTFSSTFLYNLPTGREWRVEYGTDFVNVVVVDDSACEPSPITCPADITMDNDDGDCGAIVTFTLPSGATASPSSGSFFSVGTTTVNVTGSDGCDGTSTCSFTVTINDTEAPAIKFCPNPIVNLDNTNDRCGAIIVFSPTPEDNCPGASIEQTEGPASGSLFPIGSTTVVFVATDAADLTTECRFTVNVTDNQKPEITCPSNATVGTDGGLCGADIHLPAPSADDNCGVTQLKGRYRLVDENDNPLGSYTSRMNDPSGYLAVGRYQINWRAKDAANNKRSCSYYVTVEDDEDPTAVCKDVAVDFNGEASIDLMVSQVWNEAASDDNCGTVYYVSTSPSLSISCDDLGSVVPLTVTIRDEAGNTDQCTADVTVTGLPCGWSEGPDDGSLNCPGDTDVDYDVDDESFSMSSDGCWQGSHDPDKAAYVYQELCGDGTLTARLASINTAGYAGLMLREILDPESRRAGALKDFSTRRVRREYRSSYGGSVARIHSNRSRVEWFRIVRKGDEIKSYTSTNGSYWRLLYRVVMPNLDDCVYIGLMAYSKDSSSEVEAVFDNVSFSGSGSSLIDNNNSLPNSFTAFDTDLSIEQPEVNIFPNPSNGQSQIELNGFQETPAQIMVRDAFGKVVRQIEVDYPEGTVLPLDLQDMPAGLYLISVMQEQQQVITKKLMIQK